ncbi:hypothetical protein RDABS01_020146 [Bienertia sinuspersici]
MDSPKTPIESPSPIESPMESTHQDPITLESDGEVNSDGMELPTKPKESKAIKIKPNLSGNPLKRQRKLTSSIWDEFEMIDELDASGRMQCRCKKCGVKYIAESSHGTGNMLRHIKGCKGKIYRDVGQLLLRSNASGSISSDMEELCEQVAGMVMNEEEDGGEVDGSDTRMASRTIV